jgi:hypothetical protein
MSTRIGQLEDAISCMWASKVGGANGSIPGNAAGEHPLLRPELLKIKALPDTQNALPPLPTNNDEGDLDSALNKGCDVEGDQDCITAELGMLTLDERGKGSYMGRTAKIEVNISLFFDDRHQ